MIDDIVKLATGISTEEEGRQALSLLQETATLALRQSKRELETGIICLHLIREHRLYSYGGYDDWRAYLSDFLDSESISRSLAYDLLRVVRLWTNGCGLSLDDLPGFGLYTARAALYKTVEKYDRSTGEVIAVNPYLTTKLDGRGSLGEQTGRWVIEHVPPGVSAVMVSQVTASVTNKLYVTFKPVRQAGKIVDVRWSATLPGGDQAEGLLAQMPAAIENEFLRMLNVREGD